MKCSFSRIVNLSTVRNEVPTELPSPADEALVVKGHENMPVHVHTL